MDKTIREFGPKETIFVQGAREEHVLQLISGEVMLAMVTQAGKEAVVGILASGAFLGEEILAGRRCREETATAITSCRVQLITGQQVWQMLQYDRHFREHFVAHLLVRLVRVEHNLVDQMLNSARTRLARALLLLANKDGAIGDTCLLPPLSQERLASLVGTTRSRINRFMNEFRKRGMVNYGHNGIIVKPSLLRHIPESDSPRKH